MLSKIPIPKRPKIAHVVSPTSDPICTLSAGKKPPFIPLFIVSVNTTPGAALKIRPRIKACKKNNMNSYYTIINFCLNEIFLINSFKLNKKRFSLVNLCSIIFTYKLALT